MRRVRIGCGAGFSGDRIDPAVELVERGDLDYLVFECLAERTIALAQQAKARDPDAGFDPMLVERLEAVLPACRRQGVRLVTNMGAANPMAAARTARACARRLGLDGLRIAAVGGDDVLDAVRSGRIALEDADVDIDRIGDAMVSANVYTGAEPIVDALSRGAHIVITGRAADPSLFLAPMRHEFGWAADDYARLAGGTVVGHLLECAGQLTGGYFADPGFKDVADLDRLGFPIAEVAADATAILTKVAGSGGLVTTQTCKEQLLYEVHDPASYLTPDVHADFTGVRFRSVGVDRVAVEGASGRGRPERLKVSIGYRDGFIGEGQMSYAGLGAESRARLAAEVLSRRLTTAGFARADLRVEFLGAGAPAESGRGGEVRLRIAGRAATAPAAARVGNEVEALYTNGPAGGGGAFRAVREVLAIASAFVPRAAVSSDVHIEMT